MSMSNKQKEISTLIKAGAKVVQIVSYERQRVHSFINEISMELDLPWFRWSFVSGLDEYDKDDNEFKPLDTSLTDPVKVIKSFREEGFQGILILEDYHHFLENPQNEEKTREIIRHLREIADIPKNVPKNLILSQPIKMIPIELMKEMTVVEIELPKRDILEVIFHDVIKQFQLSSDKYSISTALIDAALGLTVMEARLAFAKAIVEQGKLDQDSIELIIKEKEAIIKKRGLLEYYHPEGGLESVGGLDKLKEWLLKRGKAFEEGAEEYGLDKPRGVLLLGIPGCGKSLSAKAIAKVWHFPLLRFDLGKVYAGIVGQSEQNIRNALDIAQALAPCVLWIDEIEKGLSGVSSSDQTDSGVSARIFGTFLTWMQEKKDPVFVVATANDISKLPPELLRKGRFDEIFFVDLPTEEERKEIFKIHLTQKQRVAEKFTLGKFAEKTDGYTGAEIEEIIKEALFQSFYESRDLEDNDVTTAISNVIPLSKTMGENLKTLRHWAKYKAKFASSKNLKMVEAEFGKTLDDKNIPTLKQENPNPFITKEKGKN